MTKGLQGRIAGHGSPDAALSALSLNEDTVARYDCGSIRVPSGDEQIAFEYLSQFWARASRRQPDMLSRGYPKMGTFLYSPLTWWSWTWNGVYVNLRVSITGLISLSSRWRGTAYFPSRGGLKDVYMAPHYEDTLGDTLGVTIGGV